MAGGVGTEEAAAEDPVAHGKARVSTGQLHLPWEPKQDRPEVLEFGGLEFDGFLMDFLMDFDGFFVENQGKSWILHVSS